VLKWHALLVKILEEKDLYDRKRTMFVGYLPFDVKVCI
jgi:hypothetical protein